MTTYRHRVDRPFPQRVHAWALLFAAALIAAPWTAHVDDSDGHLYRVVVRHMLEDGTWTQLRYLPDVHARFREHLPFGFWPYAIAARVFGEGALPVVAGLFTLLTVFITGRIVSRIACARAALLAMVLLAGTESLFVYGGMPRLDPPLVLAATLAVMWWLEEKWALATLAALAAVAIKGPFGVVPLVAVATAQGITRRSLRPLVLGALCTITATAPVVLWLLSDRWWGDGSWWRGYVQEQVLASAAGHRTDGALQWWAPLETVVLRFWPGFPLLLIGAWRVAKKRANSDATWLLIAAGFSLGILALPARKVWNHAVVVFPLLAVFSSVAVAELVERTRLPVERVVRVLALTAAVACLGGVGTLLVPPPCVVSTEFAPLLRPLPPGTDVLVISGDAEWRMRALLAAELRVNPVAASALVHDDKFTVALIRDDVVPAELRRWRVVARARGWTVLHASAP